MYYRERPKRCAKHKSFKHLLTSRKQQETGEPHKLAGVFLWQDTEENSTIRMCQKKVKEGPKHIWKGNGIVGATLE